VFERKLFGLKERVGRLGLWVSRLKELRGGSSILGEDDKGGADKGRDSEKAELLSETSEGALSTESALEASEIAGEGREPEALNLGGKPGDVVLRRGPESPARDSG
jgi:hypothetical protein